LTVWVGSRRRVANSLKSDKNPFWAKLGARSTARRRSLPLKYALRGSTRQINSGRVFLGHPHRQAIEITMEFSVRPNPNVPYDIAHRDEDFLVVEKPARIVTQPGLKHEHDSLLNGIFCEYGKLLQNMGADRGWGLLHRLDKDTSGLVIVALRPQAYDKLRAQFVERKIRKTYWAIVDGLPKPAQAVIQKPIAEVAGRRKRAVIRQDGKPSITAYKILQTAGGVSLIEARPKTGRLHQIRIHMCEVGNPVLGETVYLGKSQPPNVVRLCLHAAELKFLHPITNQGLTVRAPWPKDLRKTLTRFGLDEPRFG